MRNSSRVYYIHLRVLTPGKIMNPFFPFNYGYMARQIAYYSLDLGEQKLNSNRLERVKLYQAVLCMKYHWCYDYWRYHTLMNFGLGTVIVNNKQYSIFNGVYDIWYNGQRMTFGIIPSKILQKLSRISSYICWQITWISLGDWGFFWKT